jgi:uncharacterized protein YggT (Ycf19 family)
MLLGLVLSILDVLDTALTVVNYLVLFWVVLSWAAFIAAQGSSFRFRHHTAYNLLMQLNDIFSRMAHPFLKPFRRILRRFDTAGIDWSPLLLWLTILLLGFIVRIIEGAIQAYRAGMPIGRILLR